MSGSIDAEQVVIEVPAMSASPASESTMSTTPLTNVYVSIVSIEASPGAHVSAGQALATLDSRFAAANAGLAESNVKVAQAQVGVLDAAIDSVRSNQADIASTRRGLTDAIAQLKAQRAQLSAQAEQIERSLAGMPATTAAPGRTEMAAALSRLRSGMAQIDAGLEKSRAGLRQLDSASAKLTDARAQLTGLREIALIAVDAAAVAAGAAEYQLSLATVRSPVDGIVLSIADTGGLLAPGATLSTIRPDSAPRVTTWLDAEQLSRVALGGEAIVRGDWMSEDASVPGRVTRIGDSFDYPPTSFATEAIHMTRAVRVEITIDSSATKTLGVSLPAGAPVDIIITPSGSQPAIGER